jgi:hypothetical protein
MVRTSKLAIRAMLTFRDSNSSRWACSLFFMFFFLSKLGVANFVDLSFLRTYIPTCHMLTWHLNLKAWICVCLWMQVYVHVHWIWINMFKGLIHDSFFNVGKNS